MIIERGTGSVVLTANVLRRDYLCEWFGGNDGELLAERARSGSARSAVAWGRARSARVVIETGDGSTMWAGTAPAPEGVPQPWEDVGEVVGRLF